MDAEVALQAQIDRLNAFAKSARVDAAREAAPLVSAEIQRTTAAGTDPYGVPWKPRKDGSRALPDASSAVDAVARGPIVVVRARRGVAIQNALAASVGRRVIPDAVEGVPDGIAAALAEGAKRAFEKAFSR